MNALKVFFVMLLLTGMALSGCSSHDKVKSHFTTSGLSLTSTSNATLNALLAEFPALYDKLCTAAETGNKGARLPYTKAYSDWLIKIISIKDSLPQDEGEKLATELERADAQWRQQMDKLF